MRDQRGPWGRIAWDTGKRERHVHCVGWAVNPQSQGSCIKGETVAPVAAVVAAVAPSRQSGAAVLLQMPPGDQIGQANRQ